MMNIKEIIDQINYVMDEVEDVPDKYRQLHELGWQLVNTTRPSDFYEDKEQAMKEQLSGYEIIEIPSERRVDEDDE